MPITSFMIAGVEVDPQLDSFEVRATTGEVSTLVCDVESLGSPVVRFALRDVVSVEEDGVTIFAGRITQLRERGFAGAPNLYDADSGAEQIVTSITAEDYSRVLEKVYVTETVAAGTLLKTFLTTLITDAFGTLGITLDSSQVDGPALADMTFDDASGAEVLRALEDATGYMSGLDYDKQLRMWAPGELSAPFNISEYDDPIRWTDDVEVENILGDEYANKVIVVGPVIEEYGRTETWTGDGVTTEFELVYTPFAYRVVQVGTSPPSYQTVTDPSLEGTGAAMWVYDPTTNTIRRDLSKFPDLGIPGVGEYIGFNIDGRFQPYAESGPPSGTDPEDVITIKIESDNIRDQVSAQALADSLLEEHLNAGEQKVIYKTRYTAPSIRVGQEQTIAATPRQLSGSYIITDLYIRAEVPVTSDFAATDLGFIRTVHATKTNPSTGKFQPTYRDWLKDTKGAGGAQSTSSGIGGGPAPPIRSVQFNRDNIAFGGDASFIYYDDENSVVCGGNGSSITAALFESCQVFGSNCHITD